MTRRFTLSRPAGTRRSSPLTRRVAFGLLVLSAGGCGGSSGSVSDSAAALAADSLPATNAPFAPPPALDLPPEPATRATPLSPLADSIAAFLVFEPVTQRLFVAAGRAHRLLLDLGRVDTEVRRDSARARAYRAAVAARSPFPVGMHLRLRSAWGAESAAIAGFDTWNGRIVATLRGAPQAAALAAATEPMTASAERVDSAVAVAAANCVSHLDTATPTSQPPPRLAAIRDSVLAVLTERGSPPYPRLLPTVQTRATWLRGCFGAGRLVMAVTRWAGSHEWVQEEVLLIDASGSPTRLVVNDLRFRAHELLNAFDADGDGVDDVAARAHGELVGATVILRLVDGARLERLAAGFAWESR